MSAVGPAPGLPTGPALGAKGTPDITIKVSTTEGRRPISALIYGSNSSEEIATTKPTFLRSGGNRMTAYNWENNASNAGADWCFENDAFLVANSQTPDAAGAAVSDLITAATAQGASVLLTVPIVDYVAGDKDQPGSSPPDCASDVRKSGANYLTTRFKKNKSAKGRMLSLTPDITDDSVYQDEFVNWARTTYPKTFFFFDLDNEPDAWASTHAEVQTTPVTYAEVTSKNIEFAKVVKANAPDAKVLGFVSFGWGGWTGLSGAPDANQRDFTESYLDTMKAAEASAGKRLVDVLDLHYYPEARDAFDPKDSAVGTRVTDSGLHALDPAVVAARVQAPRSLWDDKFVEQSWITYWATMKKPIALIPSMLGKIAAHYPGTELAFSEWNFGGGADISGGVAAADVLGIFGREGVYMASFFGFGDAEVYNRAAFRVYRNFDGQGATFGDTAVAATTSDIEKTSVYASTVEADASRIVLVLINKDTAVHTANIAIEASSAFTRAGVWTLTAAGSDVKAAGVANVSAQNSIVYDMPAMSVSVIAPAP
ncbi:MAG TPA: glycoside hydrolase family 44 protein [Polyangiaceae bacterium]|nr:glycoside hydrolase family 44 protein [Polyangiaceae bacterium]